MGVYDDLIRSETGLVGYYRFNDASGNFVEDGGGTAITATGTWQYAQTGLLVGNSDKAVKNGTAGQGNRAIGSIPVGQTARSFEFLWKGVPGTSGQKQVVLSYGAASTRNWFAIAFNDSASDTLGILSWADDHSVSAPLLNDGNTHHVVVTFAGNSSQVKIYFDGSLLGTVNFGGNLNTTSATFYISQDIAGSYYLNGTLDELSIWSVELNSGQVAAHARTAFAQKNRLTQEVAEVAVNPTSAKARLTSEAAEVAVNPTSGKGRLTQAAVEAAVLPTSAKARLTAEAVEVLLSPVNFMAGSTTPSGTLTNKVIKGVAGTTGPTGSVRERANKGVAGSSTPSGVLTTLVTHPQSIAERELLAVYDPDVYGMAGYPYGRIDTEVYGVPTPDPPVTYTVAVAGTITPTGALTNTFMPGITAPPPPAPGVEGGGRWRPLDPWEPGPHLFRRVFEGVLGPVGALITTVIRGKPKPTFIQPVEVLPYESPPAQPVAQPPLPVIRPVVPGPLRPLPKLRPTVEPSLDDTPTVAPAVEPELQPEPLAVTPEPVVDVTPIFEDDGPEELGPDLVIPNWPLAPRPTRAREDEPVPVALEEAFVTTTRLPLYTREELMALGRRMHIGFHAPESATVGAPSPVVPAAPESGDASGRAPGAARRATASRPRERAIPGERDRR